MTAKAIQARAELKAKFIEYDEYVYIEMDTVAGTATVLPRKD